MLIDTHCHIQDKEYPLDVEQVLARAQESDVFKMICVGINQQSSEEAVTFAADRVGVYSSIGVHPHYASEGTDGLRPFLGSPHLVAIGEIGLDYFYDHSPRRTQIAALEAQLQLAIDSNLPVIFHVREAFDDFWPIFDNFPGLRGDLHSYTDSQANLEKGLERGLFVAVNGISTFTRDEKQLKMFDSIPLNRLLLETDSPLLTPVPYRGKVNEPAFVKVIAQHHAQRRNVTLNDIATATTANATALFAL